MRLLTAGQARKPLKGRTQIKNITKDDPEAFWGLSCDLMNEKVKDCLPGDKEEFKSQHSDEREGTLLHIMYVAFTFVSQVPSLQAGAAICYGCLTDLSAGHVVYIIKVCQLLFVNGVAY